MTQAKFQLLQGDVLDFCRDYDGEPFHACMCDPPYHLTSIVKRFANGEPEHTKTANDIKHRLTPHARQAAGFMGKRWDGGDIAFRPETWEAFANLLFPGAFVFAFAGTRGWHRQAVAMEDAGLILHPSIAYIFGSGFPKATRVKDAPAFTEHRYGLQAMKPAFEPILVAQKPYKGRPVDCITKTGSGALNIGAGRIGTNDDNSRKRSVPVGAVAFGRGHAMGGDGHEAGRWPANLLLDTESAVALDAQSGHLTSGKVLPHHQAHESENRSMSGKNYARTGIETYGDAGGASRFFMQSDWEAEEYDPFFYCAKSGRAERNAGLESGTEIAVQANARPRDWENADWQKRNGNYHPTVKPLKICRYLASLLLPPAEYAPRRLFVPFAGVGSECIGAHLAGWESVVGVEGEEEYCEIGRARLKFWSCNGGLFDSLTTTEDDAEPAQTGMEF